LLFRGSEQVIGKPLSTLRSDAGESVQLLYELVDWLSGWGETLIHHYLSLTDSHYVTILFSSSAKESGGGQ
jgi:hypothetical protein